MEWSFAYVAVFAAGIILGLVIPFIAGLFQFDGVESLFGALGRGLFSPFKRLRKGSSAKPSPAAQEPAPADESQQKAAVVEAREKKLSDSAQTIRSILLSLTSVIRRADQAASNASAALVEIKNDINSAGLPPELAAAQAHLITEIDRVIANNTNLKSELADSQVMMDRQRSQIEELKTTVRIDNLTQVANRAYFDEKLTEMISLKQRYNEPFSLMMIDVDNFKDINDTHGHPVGDRALKGLVSKVRVMLRKSDFLARYGGDEFALILMKTDLKTAAEVAWKLSSNVRASRFILGSVELRITLSIGIAEARDGDTAEILLKRADDALYRVKEKGRDGVYAEGLEEEVKPV